MSTVAAAGSQNLWFISRASGLVLLALFSVVVVLGVATRTGAAPRRWPGRGTTVSASQLPPRRSSGRPPPG